LQQDEEIFADNIFFIQAAGLKMEPERLVRKSHTIDIAAGLDL
jgi:hypothetical protein